MYNEHYKAPVIVYFEVSSHSELKLTEELLETNAD